MKAAIALVPVILLAGCSDPVLLKKQWDCTITHKEWQTQPGPDNKPLQRRVDVCDQYVRKH